MIRRMPGFRFAALVGAAAVASLSLAACSGSSDKSSTDANEISFLSQFTANDANAKTFKAMTDKFTQQTGIKVTIETVNNADIAGNYEASQWPLCRHFAGASCRLFD